MTAQPRHTKLRRSAGDRLLSPDTDPRLTATDYAVAPFDRSALDANATWGQDRLVELVSPETAAKFGSAIAKLNAAIQSGDPDETAARVSVCVRGFAAMDAEARQRGHQPLSPVYWQAVHNGRRVAFVRDASAWPVVARELPGATIYTLDDMLAALAHRADAWTRSADAQAAPPLRTAVEADLDDEIPF
jgi:hypothetical protein